MAPSANWKQIKGQQFAYYIFSIFKIFKFSLLFEESSRCFVTIVLPPNQKLVNKYRFDGFPLDKGHKLNVHKSLRRLAGLAGRLLNVFCTSNLRYLSTGLGLLVTEVFSI